MKGVIRRPSASASATKKKAEENVVQLLTGAGDLETKDIEKAEVPNAFFALVFTEKICCLAFEVPEPASRVCGTKNLPIEEQD